MFLINNGAIDLFRPIVWQKQLLSAIVLRFSLNIRYLGFIKTMNFHYSGLFQYNKK